MEPKIEERAQQYEFGEQPARPETPDPRKQPKRVSRPVFAACVIGAFLLGGLLTLGGTTLLGGGLSGSGAGSGSGGSGQTAGDLVDEEKLDSIQKEIDRYYLRDLSDEEKQEMKESVYKGYVAGMGDPYSDYMSEKEFKEYMESSSGEYSGVGITFTEDEEGRFAVVGVSKDSPAEKGGIETGDFLLTVDGNTYTNTDTMASKIRGKEGTQVKLEYMHGEERKEVTLTRAVIHQYSVESEMLEGQIGYISISSFIETTGKDFHDALDKLTGEGAKALILDLRDNGGGLVDDSVAVADEFLDKGVICYTRDKDGNLETYDAKDGKTSLKTVVLVNENSASASEILAGALKDNGYEIIGKKTFGKGVIQGSFPMSDGSALKLTVLEYLTPDKHEVHEKGITPDVEVDDDKDTDADEPLEKAREELE